MTMSGLDDVAASSSLAGAVAGKPVPHDIRLLTRADAHWHLDGLAALLLDGVHAGASLGHLLPLSRDDAERDWEALQPRLSDTELLWIARDDAQVVGCIRLHIDAAPDGRHRAAIERLVVASTHRRRGIAAALLVAAEREAGERGVRLLIADVEAGSDAAHALARLGWQSSGAIPGYVMTPDGRSRDGARLFRRVDVALR